MPGIAHLASLRLVLEREKNKKKRNSNFTPFEKYLLELVDNGNQEIKRNEEEAERKSKASWLRTHLLESDVVAPEGGSPRMAWVAYHYNKAAFVANERVVRTFWFESLVMLAIVAVGIGIGLGLSGLEEENQAVEDFLKVLDDATFWVFFLEAAFKIFACGSRPWVYFMSKKDGSFNTFDFIIVAVSVAYSPFFGATEDVSKVKVLRLARLLRLLHFIEHVPEVRVMIQGLVSAMDSVWYILLLLTLVVYIFAVLGVILFADNDPANFNDVATAMMTLFQVSMFTNWSAIALVAVHGCDKVAGNGYILGLEDPLPNDEVRTSRTMGGFDFPTWHCTTPNPQPFVAYFYFAAFTILAGMVVLSLFIGVITIGMFTEYNNYQDEQDTASYQKGVEDATQALENPESVLRMAVDFAMGIDNAHVAAKLIVQETPDGVLFRLRTKDDGKTVAEVEAFSQQKTKDEFPMKSMRSVLDESVHGGAPPIVVQDEEVSSLSKSVRSRLRLPNSFIPTMSVSVSTTLNTAGSDFLSILKAQEAKTRKAVFISTKDLPFVDRLIDNVTKKCQSVDGSSLFQNMITFAILTAGLTVGLDTDNRGNPSTLAAVDFGCLLLFTVECIVKILACGKKPYKYFKDGWNQFDFVIVLNGWSEVINIFALDFLVVFRLLRLLRVFRLARAFPRLRSIVSSLMAAVGAVGWMVLLMFVFNYMAACCGMILFSKHDPFFFGDLLRSSFTVYVISTLDLWDTVMRINMYGCDTFPSLSGYPFSPDTPCEHPRAFGYFSAFFMFVVVVLAGMILPTMLIGVISIKFETSSQKFSNERTDRSMLASNISYLQADIDVSEFFDKERVEMFDGIFRLMDVDGQGRLDLNEIGPFVKYIVQDFLGYADVHQDEIENVVLFFDENDTGDLNFGEFLTCIGYLLKARLGPQKWTIKERIKTQEQTINEGKDSPSSQVSIGGIVLSNEAQERLTKLGFGSVEDLLSAHENGKFQSPDENGKFHSPDNLPRRPSKMRPNPTQKKSPAVVESV